MELLFCTLHFHHSTPGGNRSRAHSKSRSGTHGAAAAPGRSRIGVLGAALALGLNFGAVCVAPADAQTTLTAARGASTPLFLKAPPNTRCTLRTMSPHATPALDGFSNSHGIVRYVITVRADARSEALATLECRNRATHTLTGFTIVPGKFAAPTPRAAARRPLAIADLATDARFGVLPGTPHGFDVTRASDAQLVALGYPRRPDAHLSPQAYLIWRKLVTTPGAYVDPGVVVTPRVHGPVRNLRRRAAHRSIFSGATTYGATTPNWSGVVATNTPAAFSDVVGQWSVPGVSTNGNLGAGYSSAWVGIDGFGTGDVVQDGTESDAFDDYFFSYASYYAWYEFYPDYAHALSNVPVSPGDSVFAISTTYVDNNGYVNGSYYFYDVSAGTGTVASELIPAGAPYSGSSAEWIVERPTVGGGLSPMPDYGSAQISSTFAQTTDGDLFYADGSNSFGANDIMYDLLMTSDGTYNGDLLSDGYVQDANDVDFLYFNWL